MVYEGLSSCNIQRIQAKHLTSGTNYKKRQLYLAYYSIYKVSRTKIHHITYHKSQGCGLERISLCVVCGTDPWCRLLCSSWESSLIKGLSPSLDRHLLWSLAERPCTQGREAYEVHRLAVKCCQNKHSQRLRDLKTRWRNLSPRLIGHQRIQADLINKQFWPYRPINVCQRVKKASYGQHSGTELEDQVWNNVEEVFKFATLHVHHKLSYRPSSCNPSESKMTLM